MKIMMAIGSLPDGWELINGSAVVSIVIPSTDRSDSIDSLREKDRFRKFIMNVISVDENEAHSYITECAKGVDFLIEKD